MIAKFINTLLGLALSLLLTACGGGSGNSSVVEDDDSVVESVAEVEPETEIEPEVVPQTEIVQRVVSEVSNDPAILGFALITNTYDDDARLIRKDRDVNGNGVLEASSFDEFYTYAYDDQGVLLTRTRNLLSPEEYVRTIESYNEFGDVVEAEIQNGPGLGFTSFSSSTFEYDENNRKIREDLDRGNRVFDYDGNIITELATVTSTGIQIETITTTNDRGDVISEIVTVLDSTGRGTDTFNEYIYDENDNIIMKTVTGFGAEVVTFTYEDFEILVD